MAEVSRPREFPKLDGCGGSLVDGWMVHRQFVESADIRIDNVRRTLQVDGSYRFVMSSSTVAEVVPEASRPRRFSADFDGCGSG
jgi:hypothetical protein